jgi:hypothetical protein
VLPDAGLHDGVPTPVQLSVAVTENVATAPLGLVQFVFTLTGQLSTGGVVSTTVTTDVQSSVAPSALMTARLPPHLKLLA